MKLPNRTSLLVISTLAICLPAYASFLPFTDDETGEVEEAGRYESEAGYFEGAEVLQDESASDGAFVLLGSESALWQEIETTHDGQSLMIVYRSPGTQRTFEVVVGDQPVGTLAAPSTTSDGEWGTVYIPVAIAQPGPFIVQITTTGETPGGLEMDCMAVCELPAGEPCGGCSAAPLTPGIISFESSSIMLPPAPGGAGLYVKLLKLVKFKKVSIFRFSASTTSGECELKPKEGQEPCGEKECKPKSGCSLLTHIEFYPNNYARPPRWDRAENITSPSGKPSHHKRDGNLVELDDTMPVGCGTGVLGTWQFESGSVIQPVSCNACD
ncbi:hypothetical protein Poly30_56190 [Planctomycetes bacterium Poly30]|uniref:Carbohydrate binding module (Family 6) n=1 Tax=Saltatorellus ferox TaxID=2528018 RepID=A0A518F140_9BACT|nr:hypothetical protein Poly30_56190 [Planctomycetes bacterium Poly30]